MNLNEIIKLFINNLNEGDFEIWQRTLMILIGKTKPVENFLNKLQ